ncbi:N-acetyltransferase [Halobacillus rhizosphaerae]|uniref:GNAT family N-acetyltransferase n=1 Tax=Halobacillus rhizosphaerae TaxID=3064889 RepID=UPI00398A775C
MVIMPAVQKDLEEILRHTAESFNEGSQGNYYVNDALASEMMNTVLLRGGRVLVMKEPDTHEFAGWILYGIEKDEITQDDFGFIYELHVLKPYRKRGYATALMEEALHQLKHHGLKRVRLVVYKGNFAIDLYEKLGFSQHRIVMDKPI